MGAAAVDPGIEAGVERRMNGHRVLLSHVRANYRSRRRLQAVIAPVQRIA